MRARRIFRGALAGVMAVSLLFSGIPAAAAELNGPAPQNEAADNAGTDPMPKQQGNPGESEAEATGPQEIKDAGAQGDSQANTESPSGTGEEAPGHAGSQDSVETGATGDGSQNGLGTDAESSGGDQDGNGNEENSGSDGSQNSAEPEKNTDTKPDGSEDGKAKKDAKAEIENAGFKDSVESIEGTEEKAVEGKDATVTRRTVRGNIEVDGELPDWENVASRASNASNVDSWKAAFSPDGNTLYLSYTGTASTEWDYSFASNDNKFEFVYPDGAAGENSGVSVNAWNGGAVVKNAYWGDVPGAEAAVKNHAHGNNPGPYAVELSIPASFLHNGEFTLTFGGCSVASADIEQMDGNSIVVEVPPVYNGIAIDGDYSDWKAVSKTDVSCPNSAHTGCLSEVAAVYDGDWFYIYIKDGKGSNASGAGTHSNGKFAITSDLGYETDIQLSTSPAVNGVDGAQVAYVGNQWEIAIPKGQLPKYRESLSFGLYLGEPFLTGIVNLQPDSENNLEHLFDGIVYDGQYEDWEDYGHSTIEYATAGSQESQVDAKGALYSSDGRLYGHVVTDMPQHLQEAGGEFTSAVTIAFNQSAQSLGNGSYDQNMAFYPRYVAVDAGGGINWDPQLSGLAEGTYEYYIASRDAWHTSTNINNLNEMDQLYGKMIMTVGKDGKDEMEFYLELPMVAKKLGVDETDLKEISAQFGRIGQQWIFTAGTSTGPVAGVLVCIASVGAALWNQKRKKEKRLPAPA